MNNQDSNWFLFFLIVGSMMVISICGAIYGIAKGIISLFS